VHEVAIAEGIVESALRHLEPLAGHGPVTEVTVRIGALSGVSPDALTFAFEAVTADTPLAGAALRIENVPAVVRCTECGAESDVDPLALLCPVCGSPRTEIVRGQELHLIAIEIAD